MATIAPDTIHILGELVRLLAIAVCKAFDAIGFVVRQRRERKKADGHVVWAFMGQKVPMMSAPKFLNQGNPSASVFFEFRNFRWVQFILNITGYQRLFLTRFFWLRDCIHLVLRDVIAGSCWGKTDCGCKLPYDGNPRCAAICSRFEDQDGCSATNVLNLSATSGSPCRDPAGTTIFDPSPLGHGTPEPHTRQNDLEMSRPGIW